MKNFSLKFPALAIFLACLFLTSFEISAQKLSAEEIVAKHLDSIGKSEKRAEIKNRFLFADVKLIVKGTVNPIQGKAVVLSANEKNLWGMNLSSNDYPQDRFAFDGKRVNVGYSRPGVRSVLGGFILSYDELLEEGLLGGTLTSSWALLAENERNGKLDYEGTKKIDGKETYVLSYSPKGGSDLSIKMYFDQKNFRHVRTEYNRVIAARQGSSIDNSASQTADTYRLVEDFSNFENFKGLTLPKTYKISYSFNGSVSPRSAQNITRELEWTFTVTNLSYNQELPADAFDINAK